MKEIDAKNRTIGRVASEAAMALMGKDKANYKSNINTGTDVKIINASRLRIREVKKQTKYTRYTGYPGGLKHLTLAQIIAAKGIAEVLRNAVLGMIPNNKLRTDRMKKLTIVE